MNNERKRILKMVEEGKLTVDEALTLLEELEKATKTMEQKQEEIVNELSTAVHLDEEKKEDPFQHKFQSAKDKIFDFVDSALKKIKDFDLDFNFGTAIEISHIFHQGDAYLKDLDIDVANGSVKIIPWEKNDVRVECQAKVYRVETTEEARESFLKDVHFAIEGQRMRFAVQQKWMKVDASIYIPRSEYESVKIRMFNGPIEGENLKAGKLTIKTANGKIDLAEVTCKNLEAETANGRIKVRKGIVDDLDAETINGAIQIDGDFEKVDIQTFNGNVVCSVDSTRCERIGVEAVTGSIDIDVPTSSVSGELKTNLGGFSMDLEGIRVVEEKSDIVQKTLRFEAADKTSKLLRVNAETKTGSIKVRKLIGNQPSQ